MYPGMLEAIRQKGLLPNIAWEVVVDSSEVGFCKPNSEIYELAQDRAGVKPEEILFVDNTRENIEAAKRLGWQAVLYESSSGLETYFSRAGLF